MASTNPARGMRDFLPADVRKREYVIGIIKEVYESYGFEPLETPAVENLETLMGKYGEEGNQLIYRILKRRDKFIEGLRRLESAQQTWDDFDVNRLRNLEDMFSDLALRYDLTVPLARVVADNRNDLPKFFKRYQIQPVWRADRPARGRFREFYQCDVDAIGSSSMVVEAELILAVTQILKRLGFDDFVIRLNHREVLRDILDTAGVPAEKHADALVAIDKLDKIGGDGVKAELESRGVSEDASAMLLDIFEETQEIVDDGKDVNRTIVSNLINIVSNEVLTDIGSILRFAADSPVQLDPSLARGLSYYTGAIIEVNVPDLAGSLAGGGRYDGLIGMFGKEQIPACGISLGLERILVVMDERGMFPPEIAESTPADVMIAMWSEETAGESLKLAQELRAAGLRVILYPEPDKLGKQFKYADAIKVTWVGVLGETELADGKVTLKNLRIGKQETIPRQEATERFRKREQ
ncbi:MAG TPA: histidine--tRNA ligase [Pyrinomonadaceae bacterium]|nr:histidine--tRNA ligase [Pyrinomonadaceae bacterium]